LVVQQQTDGTLSVPADPILAPWTTLDASAIARKFDPDTGDNSLQIPAQVILELIQQSSFESCGF